MFFLVEKRSDKVEIEQEGYARYAVRQCGGYFPSAWLIWELGIGIPILLTFLISPYMILLLFFITAFSIPVACEDWWPKNHKALWLVRIKRDYEIRDNISNLYWDNEVKQLALKDMLDEWDRLKDNFDISEWRPEFRELDVQLKEQAEIEKRALKSNITRTRYSDLVKETNEIMREGLEQS